LEALLAERTIVPAWMRVITFSHTIINRWLITHSYAFGLRVQLRIVTTPDKIIFVSILLIISCLGNYNDALS
jgi:hypothetical protein